MRAIESLLEQFKFIGRACRPMNLASVLRGVTLASIPLRNFLPNVSVNHTAGSSASTLDVRGFLVFQLLIVLREITNLNAACF